jgi:L-fuconolactonase
MTVPPRPAVIDSHVHFWDPAALEYPWLEGLPSLRRPFLPRHLRAAAEEVPLQGVVFVEANPRPDQGVEEVRLVRSLTAAEPRVLGIVAFASLSDPGGLPSALDALQAEPRVRGLRHNIQGNPPGFCLRTSFVEGVREVGRRGLTFDLCATHDQLGEVVELARRAPYTRLVLDHCGKPAIRTGAMEPWRAHVRALADLPHLWCKLSGLLTEAGEGWTEERLEPYAAHVAECFGPDRLLYGSDWPVLTLAGRYRDWYQFTRRLTRAWTEEEQRRFFHDNARECYGL